MDFYEFYEGLQEGWDGPALLVFSDGERVGARLDRNGLRPARFWVTADDMVYVASEARPLLPNLDAAMTKAGYQRDRAISRQPDRGWRVTEGGTPLANVESGAKGKAQRARRLA